MRVLILGGTGFVGRHIADALAARGHVLTLFHRGRSSPRASGASKTSSSPRASGASKTSSSMTRDDAYEHVLGDRDRDLDGLRSRDWDVIVDTSGYEVASVRASARLAASGTARYVFVSSISVYAQLAHMDEGAPLRETSDAEHAKLTLENYGALKAACERALDEELPGRVLRVRAGRILGPHDYDERFPWLLRRVARGGEVIAPGDPEAPVQFVDARDLGAWIASCAERGVIGAFNATGPDEPLTMRSLLELVREATGSDASFVWAPDEVLLANGVAPYSEMPFWLPKALGARPVDIRRASAEGLAFRPALATVRDTWAWLEHGWEASARVRANRRMLVTAGISESREEHLLTVMREANLRR